MQNFHFIISTTLNKYLRPIATQVNLRVTQLIGLFVELSITQIDLLYQEYGRTTRSHYELVDVKGKINMHIILPENIYKQAKWLHGYYNNYSMAQIVRRCIFLMLILIKKFGSLEGAIAAIERLNQATEKQHKSKDKHGVINNHLEISQLLGNIHPSYEVVARYIYYMLYFAHPIPKIDK